MRSMRFVMFVVMLVVGVGRPASAQLTVDWSPCVLQIEGPAMEGATSYRLTRAVRNPCTGEPWGHVVLGTFSTPSCDVYSIVAGQYYFILDGLNAANVVVGTVNSGWVDVSEVGPPTIASASATIQCCPGEMVTISTASVSPGASLRWYRDGAEIPGVSAASFAITVGSGDHNAVFVPVATNECGSTIGGARSIQLMPVPSSGILTWTSVRRWTTSTFGQSSGGCIPSCVPGPPITSLGFYPVIGGSCTGSGFSESTGSIGASGALASAGFEFRFRILAPSLATFSGSVSRAMTGCGSGVCGSAGSTISGPVNMTLSNTPAAWGGSWGPVTVELPIGEYLIRTYAGGGSICTSSTCSGCGASNSSISATFALQPPACVGDLNQDGIVGAADLTNLFVRWGLPGILGEDLDGSGVVDPGDLSILIGAWGSCGE